jgi:polyhydroxyalkanoate synthase subunit PhaC
LHTRHKAEFYVRQIANALSPSNFVAHQSGTAARDAEVQRENLVRGMQMLAEDIEAGGGDLKIRQSDPEQVRRSARTSPPRPARSIHQND